jgi:hypothetical protein
VASTRFTATWIQRRCLNPDGLRRRCARARSASGGDSAISWTLAREPQIYEISTLVSVNKPRRMCGAL